MNLTTYEMYLIYVMYVMRTSGRAVIWARLSKQPQPAEVDRLANRIKEFCIEQLKVHPELFEGSLYALLARHVAERLRQGRSYDKVAESALPDEAEMAWYRIG